MVVAIIGGGASGMAAALAAAENPGTQVILLERQARLGRKLLATGNGRCNLSNEKALPGVYHGEDSAFADAAIQAFSPQATLSWFRSLGLYTVTEPSGKIYPYSDQANSVVDVLRFALEKPNIRVITGYEVTKIKKMPDGFCIENGEENILCNRLIVACGGLAGTKLGGSMAGYKLLGKLGHTSTRLRPALVQLKTDWPGISALKGVRANCRAEILFESQIFAQGCGEIQFTEYGVSGPVIFDISRDVCSKKGSWSCRLDLLPHVTETELIAALSQKKKDLSVEELLTGILHNRLGRVVTRYAGVRNGTVGDLSCQQIADVCHAVKNFDIPLTEPMGMDCAQVTAGGVRTCDFDCNTMESKLVAGLYACGEVLDVDGDCGGYNLQWAWSSGRMAGLHAGKDS